MHQGDQADHLERERELREEEAKKETYDRFNVSCVLTVNGIERKFSQSFNRMTEPVEDSLDTCSRLAGESTADWIQTTVSALVIAATPQKIKGDNF